uniref:Class I SAM-dependent rRNA methyltransferase n=1 Tax=candidate division WOR-3 bacterium TaxID=2052148 RepID=A0A7V3RGX9_UNCW3
MKKVIVRRHHPNHPWIFSNEIIKAEDPSPGEVVRVEEGKKVVGSGFYNPHSLICVRLFADKEEDFSKNLVFERIKQAYNKRKDLGESFRLVYSESDGLPGLIIDKYNDYLVIEVNCLGMDKRKELVVQALIELFNPAGIYEKSDENLRKLEGLEIVNKKVYGEIPELIEIEQDGIRFLVDIINGQKTGFFFDQRENRRKITEIARGEILDCFCYTGGFSLYTASKGNVLGIDSSESALELAKRNAALNNLKIDFELMDVFKALRKFYNEDRRFDTIILDPPSFTKSKKKKADALRGYKEINLMAMKLLNKDGVLFTSSCSYHISDEEFLFTLRDSAKDAKADFIIIHKGTQAKDHPVLLNFPESNYLKAYFLQKV